MYFPPKPTRGWPGTSLHRNLINDPRVICEPKHDGDRCLVVYGEDGVELWSRHGTRTRYTWLTELRKELAAWDLPEGAILDCELCHEPKPNQDLYVFDIPSAEGTLEYRREVLVELFEELPESEYIHLVQPYTDKEHAYEQALKEGMEGVVWKNLDSEYKWQHNTTNAKVPHWVKMKPRKGFE